MNQKYHSKNKNMDPKTQKDLYKPTYRHFKLRLLKRYGIRIDFYDYCMLHNVKLSMKQKKFNSKGQVSIQGYLIIHDMAVKVIKSKNLPGKPLITVLPLTKKDIL